MLLILSHLKKILYAIRLVSFSSDCNTLQRRMWIPSVYATSIKRLERYIWISISLSATIKFELQCGNNGCRRNFDNRKYYSNKSCVYLFLVNHSFQTTSFLNKLKLLSRSVYCIFFTERFIIKASSRAQWNHIKFVITSYRWIIT